MCMGIFDIFEDSNASLIGFLAYNSSVILLAKYFSTIGKCIFRVNAFFYSEPNMFNGNICNVFAVLRAILKSRQSIFAGELSSTPSILLTRNIAVNIRITGRKSAPVANKQRNTKKQNPHKIIIGVLIY